MNLQTIKLGSISINVVLKDINNIHLSVHPPHGTVRISAPQRTNLDTIRLFAIAKLSWIKQQQRKLQSQQRETPRECLNQESHYLWGDRYLLEIVEQNQAPYVQLQHKKIILQVRPNSTQAKKNEVLQRFYRQQLKDAIPPLIAQWEPLIGVKISDYSIRKMKTKWGSCSPASKTIRLNLELAKKPPKYLEYIVVHEMTHLLEPTHNKHFVYWMNTFLPNWKSYQADLNRLPTKYEKWGVNGNEVWKLD